MGWGTTPLLRSLFSKINLTLPAAYLKLTTLSPSVRSLFPKTISPSRYLIFNLTYTNFSFNSHPFSVLNR